MPVSFFFISFLCDLWTVELQWREVTFIQIRPLTSVYLSHPRSSKNPSLVSSCVYPVASVQTHGSDCLRLYLVRTTLRSQAWVLSLSFGGGTQAVGTLAETKIGRLVYANGRLGGTVVTITLLFTFIMILLNVRLPTHLEQTKSVCTITCLYTNKLYNAWNGEKSEWNNK
jgi:hypothetical protein